MIASYSLAAVVALAAAASGPAREVPKHPAFALPDRYGSVVIDNQSKAAGIAPVTFEHWRHRLIYTCRVCHVDIGFAMEAGRTGITAESIKSGLHCGACHDGVKTYLGDAIVPACGGPGDATSRACKRCHGRNAARARAEFERFARGKPRDASGLIDWEKAEHLAFDPPIDHVEGVSLGKGRIGIDKNFSIDAIGTWLGEVAFSHQKHARWTGCEACHPEIFPKTLRGAAQYKMKDINDGAYCGACHNKVAFPIAACLKCHKLPPSG